MLARELPSVLQRSWRLAWAITGACAPSHKPNHWVAHCSVQFRFQMHGFEDLRALVVIHRRQRKRSACCMQLSEHSVQLSTSSDLISSRAPAYNLAEKFRGVVVVVPRAAFYFPAFQDNAPFSIVALLCFAEHET